jgi:hypothetical protein
MVVPFGLPLKRRLNAGESHSAAVIEGGNKKKEPKKET